MSSSNTPFTVSTELDKISPHASLMAHTWTPVVPAKPNQVVARFATKPEAQAVFDAIKALDIKAFKNWMV